MAGHGYVCSNSWLHVSNVQNPVQSPDTMESYFHGRKLLPFLNPEGIFFSMHPDAPLRRITTWLVILGYLLVASGLPLPLGGVASTSTDGVAAKRLAAKDRSRPFPCMDKACGCATAEQCFTSCCCNTPAETLAWAKAHQVEPAVLLVLEHRVSRVEIDRLNVAKATPEPSCCSAAETEAGPSCCATADLQSNEELPEPPRGRAVTLRAMLACGGIVAEWFAAGAALPPPRVELSLATSILEVCTPADEVGECLRASPAAPPPRAA